MNSSYLHWVQIMPVYWETWGMWQVVDAQNILFEQVTMSTAFTLTITEILQRLKDEWIRKMSIHFSKKKKRDSTAYKQVSYSERRPQKKWEWIFKLMVCEY